MAAHEGAHARLTQLREALDAQPADAGLYLARAAVLSAHREHADALVDLDRAATLDPDVGALHLERARALAGLGCLDAAERHAVAHLARRPDDGTAWRLLAQVLDRLPL